MPLTFGICFKQHFDTGYLVFYNPSPHRMLLSLDLLSEYRIQHGANGPLYVTSSYSTWIFCRGASGFATDCPCDVWFRGLIMPPACWSTFWKSNFKQQLGCRFDIMDNVSYFFVWHMQLYMSWYIRLFFGFAFLNILYIFSSTLVLKSYIDVVFILSIRSHKANWAIKNANICCIVLWSKTVTYFASWAYSTSMFHGG